MTILMNLIVDGISLFAAYSLNFIVCDLMYHDFHLQQALKGSYWFILGPVLYVFGPGLAWVEAWIKTIVAKEKNKIKGVFENAWHNIDPFDLAVVPKTVMQQTLFTDEAIKLQQENLEYLREIGRQ